VLAAIDPELHPPRPVRETGVVPWSQRAAAGELPAVLGSLAGLEAGRIGAGGWRSSSRARGSPS
jgi:hypothetical protein